MGKHNSHCQLVIRSQNLNSCLVCAFQDLKLLSFLSVRLYAPVEEVHRVTANCERAGRKKFSSEVLSYEHEPRHTDHRPTCTRTAHQEVTTVNYDAVHKSPTNSRLYITHNGGRLSVVVLTFILLSFLKRKGKGSSYSITERRVPELIPVLGSQPAGDLSHKPGGRLPLLSAGPAVTLATVKIAATNFAD